MSTVKLRHPLAKEPPQIYSLAPQLTPGTWATAPRSTAPHRTTRYTRLPCRRIRARSPSGPGGNASVYASSFVYFWYIYRRTYSM